MMKIKSCQPDIPGLRSNPSFNFTQMKESLHSFIEEHWSFANFFMNLPRGTNIGSYVIWNARTAFFFVGKYFEGVWAEESSCVFLVFFLWTTLYDKRKWKYGQAKWFHTTALVSLGTYSKVASSISLLHYFSMQVLLK